jgi:hypothetical protein
VIWNQIEEEEDEKGRHVHLGVCVIRIWRGIQTGDPSSRFWFLGLTKRSRAGDAYIFIFNTHINFWFASFSFYLFKNFNDLIRLLAERAQIAQSSRFDLRDFSIFNNQKLLFSFLLCDGGVGGGGFPSAISSIQKKTKNVPCALWHRPNIFYLFFSRRIRFVFFLLLNARPLQRILLWCITQNTKSVTTFFLFFSLSLFYYRSHDTAAGVRENQSVALLTDRWRSFLSNFLLFFYFKLN